MYANHFLKIINTYLKSCSNTLYPDCRPIAQIRTQGENILIVYKSGQKYKIYLMEEELHIETLENGKSTDQSSQHVIAIEDR